MTLYDRSKGVQAKKDAQTNQQALLPAAESILVNHIRCCSATSFLLNPADVRNFASTLKEGEAASSAMEKISISWLQSFLLQHPELKSTWSQCLENAHVRGTDKQTILEWFSRFQEIIMEYRISSNNIFNMDETGFVFGLGSSQHVIMPGGDPAGWFKAQPGNHQNATVIEAISSGGQVLLPLIITKGKLHTVGEQWHMEDILATWHFSKGPSSWTDNDLTILWVENIFDVNTKLSMPSEWCLLIIDSHASHTSSRFINTLWKRHILPVCLLAHTMHVMQPLDVSIFGPITAAYQHLVTQFAPHVDAAGINKAQFSMLYTQAQVKMLTLAAAKKAFQDTRLTNHLVSEKVLSQLAGLTNAGHRSSPSKPLALKQTLLPQTPDVLDATLTTICNDKDKRDLCMLKQLVLEAFKAAQMEKEAAQVEVLVLWAQLEKNTAASGKAGRKKGPGDRMILSKDRMISQEYAE
ncbi:related to transposase [Sporisorium reilianum f. sp. reilianum]|uniref:Related to transposase n=1 Tax=Sporisorium reilianum f. sp. reilianum TaxID=72559 RepID=A0A2N8UBB7_9BASI|nr:related to transposase [Sporisorium reilianum f. sp. reilianum]